MYTEMLREIATQALFLVVVFLIVAMFVGQLAGQPVLLSYVETGSMEPEIDSGDGFVAIPAALSSSPSEGDVVTFRAEEIEGGGLTTHRIVGETEEGYITRGDANPFTDQDSGEPPVPEEKIVAHAVQVNGDVLTIPNLGTGIEGFQGLLTGIVGLFGFDDTSPTTVGVGLFGLGAVLLVVSVAGDRTGPPGRSRDRSRSTDDQYDTRILAVLLLVLVLLPANAAMLLPGGNTEFAVDGNTVAETEGVDPGDEVTGDVTARNDGLIAVVTVFEPPEDVSIEPSEFSVPAGGTVQAEASLPAPEPGEQRVVSVEQHRYLGLLPESMLLSLHDRDPRLALGVINALIAVAVLGAVGGLLGFREVRRRDTSRDRSLWLALKRRLRN